METVKEQKMISIEIDEELHNALETLLKTPGCPAKDINALLREIFKHWRFFWEQIALQNPRTKPHIIKP